MKSYNNIATLIRTKRLEHPKKYSQNDVAGLLGFEGDELISDIEEAECNVPLSLMPKLSKVLDIDPNEFMSAVMKDHEESLERFFAENFKEHTLFM